MARRYRLPVDQHHRTDRHVSVRSGTSSLFEGQAHGLSVG
jgi:hypothetical protein